MNFGNNPMTGLMSMWMEMQCMCMCMGMMQNMMQPMMQQPMMQPVQPMQPATTIQVATPQPQQQQSI